MYPHNTFCYLHDISTNERMFQITSHKRIPICYIQATSPSIFCLTPLPQSLSTTNRDIMYKMRGGKPQEKNHYEGFLIYGRMNECKDGIDSVLAEASLDRFKLQPHAFRREEFRQYTRRAKWAPWAPTVHIWPVHAIVCEEIFQRC